MRGSRTMTIAGEGQTNLGEASEIRFNENGTHYTIEDIRFTVKSGDLYVILSTGLSNKR